MATRESDPNGPSEAMLEAMNVTRDFLRRRQLQKRDMDALAPKTGEAAPDFCVFPLVNGSLSGESVRLSNFLGRPLALLFGSYTCPIFRDQVSRYQVVYNEFRSKAHFLWIYVLEAHPENGWRVPHNYESGINIPLPETLTERAAVAARCVREKKSSIPIALDDMKDSAMLSYAGSPERLYVIDSTGIVRHKSSIGPFDDEDVDLWRQALISICSTS